MTPQDKRDPNEQIREREIGPDPEPTPWTAPDFVEKNVCAEIGAYSFAEK